MLLFTGFWVDCVRYAAIVLGFLVLALAASAAIDPKGVAYRRPIMVMVALLVAETIVVSVEALGRAGGAGLVVRVVALLVGLFTIWRITWGARTNGPTG